MWTMRGNFIEAFKGLVKSHSRKENVADKTGEKRTESKKPKKYDLYRLVNTRGGGSLLPFMRYAVNTGDESMINELVNKEVKPFTYHGGKGKLIPVAELVLIRNRQRNALLGALYRKKGKGKKAPNILESVDQEGNNRGNLRKVLKLLDGSGGNSKNEAKYRDVVWRLSERGAMGETLVGVCLMQGSPHHNALARKLIMMFPKMVNDICISEDCYGLSPLHQAIMNEDSAMVYFLLRRGADVNARCYGAWFCPDDQKSSRTDSLEHESVELSLSTDYGGRMYFGEYPLSLAACTNQTDCFRLLIAKKANPNLKDTNGNTVLHLIVIHNQIEMLSLAYECGARLHVFNRQSLTPLTLAARLAKKKMFEHILKLEAEVIWVHRDVSVIAYPLSNIDTIDQRNGELNEDSALSQVVYGETRDHLSLLDGLLGDLVHAKWIEFGKRRLMMSFLAFLAYFIGVFVVFICRSSTRFEKLTGDNSSISETLTNHLNKTAQTAFVQFLFKFSVPYSSKECVLWWYHIGEELQYGQLVRLIAELYVFVATICQVIDDVRDLRNVGQKRLWKVLKAFPAKIAYKCSFIFVLATLPIRLFCGMGTIALFLEDVLAVLTVLCVTAHFLFFARAIKFIGPFILMIYTIVAHDISRFLLIYSIFVLGFSQGFYVVFLSCNREKMLVNGTLPTTRIQSTRYMKGVSAYFDMSSPAEAAIRLFIMALGEYTVFYRQINDCADPFMRVIGKMLFILYQLLVSLLMINLLIAMLTRTFDQISRSQKEWKRQWAQVILMVELSMKPQDRLIALRNYTRPIQTDKFRRSFIVTRRMEIQNFSELEKRQREKRLQQLQEQRLSVLRKRLKDLWNRGSLQSVLPKFSQPSVQIMR
ncbi:Transient receptor potential cation channel subfamily V member 5 [Toxocara canis]|uniref:Transient receptor potential cation channel subfamily V member 5 n=1 Tax=Toxocara canis TaxID=6265 RepID=A0A0B2VJJ5_TOXCA|nr:Transient receptor potential cation channel subfamily V member 5 [Toxocara canis]